MLDPVGHGASTSAAGLSYPIANGANGGSGSQSKSALRSRHGCLTCRNRKVKCNEAKPICAQCGKKNRQCIWTNGGDNPPKRLKRTNSPRTAEASEHPDFLQLNGTSNNHDWPFPTNETTSASFTLPAVPVHNHSQNHAPVPSLQAQPQPTTTAGLPFDPNDPFAFLTNLSFPPPSAGRFYIPPDFLPKTALADTYHAVQSNRLARDLVHPAKKAEMMADPAFLAPYFPALEDRLVMRHYLLETVHIIVAFECPRRPWNPWIEIHAPLAFNHLPGTSLTSDALKKAMLAVGAVHLRHLHDSSDLEGAWKILRSAKTEVMSLVRRAIDSQETTSIALGMNEIEMLIGALLSCTIASSLAADDGWHDLLSTVVALVDKLGGAESLLKEGSHEHLSPFRFMMEQLAIREVFGCMTTSLPPQMMNTGFTSWFFTAEKWSKGDDEWESVERMFGLSRRMIDIMARTCHLISKIQPLDAETVNQCRPSDAYPSNNESERDDITLRLPPRALARITSHTGQPSISESSGLDSSQVAIRAEADALLNELASWDKPASFARFHPRTQYGNHSYRHAILIKLLRQVLRLPASSPRVQASVCAIIELGVELLATYGRITWLTWPIMVAAFNMSMDDPKRSTALLLLEEFGHYACYDNQAACLVLEDYWLNVSGNIDTPIEMAWRKGKRPFLD